MMKPRNRPATTSSKTPLSGFTLLEVLLTAMLSAVLMLGLWTIFGTYLRLFKMGEVKAEQSQMVRALTQQFSIDLMGVIQPAQHNRLASENAHRLAIFSPSAEGNSTSSSGSFAASSPATIIQTAGSSLLASSVSTSLTVPRFGLKGTETSLRLDGLQAALDTPPPADPDDFFSENEPSAGPRAPELRTILYSFRERSEYSSSAQAPAAGLLRHEFEWETGSRGMRGSNLNGRHSRRRPLRPKGANESGFPELTEAELLEAEAMDESLLWVPEVMGLEFRYFDGREWHSQWDSHQKKSLPVAVEMIIALGFQEKPRHRDHEIATHFRKKESADNDETFENDRDDQNVSVFHQLVYLPFAAANHATESHATATGSATTGSDPFSPGGAP